MNSALFLDLEYVRSVVVPARGLMAPRLRIGVDEIILSTGGEEPASCLVGKYVLVALGAWIRNVEDVSKVQILSVYETGHTREPITC